MKYASLKYLCLLVIAFSFSSAGAQGIKFPLFYKPSAKSTILESYQSANLQPQYAADSSKAKLLSLLKNYSIYALPLDGTRCLATNEPIDRSMNAWKPEDNAGFAITIPNALEIRNILPQKTVPLSLLTK